MLNVTEAAILSWADRESYFAALTGEDEPADDLASRRQRVLEAGGGVN